jgi:hypothetical protein
VLGGRAPNRGLVGVMLGFQLRPDGRRRRAHHPYVQRNPTCGVSLTYGCEVSTATMRPFVG